MSARRKRPGDDLGAPEQSPAERRDRLVELVRSLPEAEIEAAGVQHLSFRAGKRTFAYYLNDHHDDGKIAICCKAAPGEQETRVRLAPDRYYVPAYLGSKGWVSLRLDQPQLDWSEVEELLNEAYRLVAPKRLRARLD